MISLKKTNPDANTSGFFSLKVWVNYLKTHNSYLLISFFCSSECLKYTRITA